jgi:tetrahydromethanopterin S-methyltransferase subunit G
MTKLTTFKEAAVLLAQNPSDPRRKALMADAAQVANEWSELEYRALKARDAILDLIEQEQELSNAEVAQRITEIRTGIGR